MATPLTCGFFPTYLILPALPYDTFSCSLFPTCPITAMQELMMILASPDGIFNCAYLPSFATSWAEEPALLTSFAPSPGFNSILWINVPRGISLSGIAFPGLISALGPDITTSPILTPVGARIYLYSPSAYFSNAILADLLGSYSIVATVAGIPILLRLKSMILYRCLLPPPRCHTVTVPSLFLPPVFFNGTVRALRGASVVMSL